MKSGKVFIHEKALCENEIGDGSRVWAYTHIMKDCSIGKNCNIGSHSFIESGAIIGDNCTIKNGVAIWNGVELESDVFVGPYVTFTNDLIPRTKSIKTEFKLVPTKLKRGVSVGANTTIICGIILNEFCMIGAGSTVTKDVPAYALLYGNPARVHGWVSESGERLEFDEQNQAKDTLGNTYQLENNQVFMLRRV